MQGIDVVLKYFDDFSPKQMQQLQMLGDLYKEWNEKINVISRKDVDELYLHHVLHSLTIATLMNFNPGTEIIDIGCGGGFPGVPMAIFFPDVKFYLVDSIAKKLKVVDGVCEATGISNITTRHSRVEDIKDRKFDFAISRAVAPLKELWKWSKPVLKKENRNDLPNGLICLKGGDLHQEIFESGTRPKMMSVYDIFKEEYFKEKFLLYVNK